MFACKTEGVLFNYEISHSDVKSGVVNDKVILSNTYIITAYATKDGYADSEKVKVQIEVKGGLEGDLNHDNVINAADVVKLTNIIMNQ